MTKQFVLSSEPSVGYFCLKAEPSAFLMFWPHFVSDNRQTSVLTHRLNISNYHMLVFCCLQMDK